MNIEHLKNRRDGEKGEQGIEKEERGRERGITKSGPKNRLILTKKSKK